MDDNRTVNDTTTSAAINQLIFDRREYRLAMIAVILFVSVPLLIVVVRISPTHALDGPLSPSSTKVQALAANVWTKREVLGVGMFFITIALLAVPALAVRMRFPPSRFWELYAQDRALVTITKNTTFENDDTPNPPNVPLFRSRRSKFIHAILSESHTNDSTDYIIAFDSAPFDAVFPSYARNLLRMIFTLGEPIPCVAVWYSLPEKLAARIVAVYCRKSAPLLRANTRIDHEIATSTESVDFDNGYVLTIQSNDDLIPLFQLFDPPFILDVTAMRDFSWEQRGTDLVVYVPGQLWKPGRVDELRSAADAVYRRYLEL